jgi:beta-aspartyl-peptidase (threonine type)
VTFHAEAPSMTARFALALHGGAGTIAPGTAVDEAPYRSALLEALAAGQTVLEGGGSALDAVVASVVALEDCPLFNAGRGAVFASDGRNELDAGVMDGGSLAAGAVAGVRTVRNPILAALEVLRDGRSVILGGEGAEAFARERGLAIVDPSYFSTPQRLAQLRAVQATAGSRAVVDHDAPAAADGDARSFGTVGAVALDVHGHLAAATSTGGLTNKMPGRLSDSSHVGAGVYANDATCAVSCTGTGERFIRACVAYDIHARMRYLGRDLAAAAKESIAQGLEPLGGRGGVIAAARDGALAMPFNATGMYRAWVREGEPARVAVFAS